MRATKCILAVVVVLSILLLAGAASAQRLVIRTGPTTPGYIHYEYPFGNWWISYTCGSPQPATRYYYPAYSPQYYGGNWGGSYQLGYRNGYRAGWYDGRYYGGDDDRRWRGREIYYDMGLYNGVPLSSTIYFAKPAKVFEW